MDDLVQTELSQEAVSKYGSLNAKRLEVERWNTVTKLANEEGLRNDPENFIPSPLKPLKLDQKIMFYLEQWWMRYLFALLFIYLVPKIKAYMVGDTSRGEPGEFEDEDDDEYEDYKEFKRYKKSMR
ncbi:MAG: hypothetical protein JWQ09_1132 [Segetibacter sp.]|nr:hypothetical protein [Segetibacter sp.]